MVRSGLKVQYNQLGRAQEPDRQVAGPEAAAHIHFFQAFLKKAMAVACIFFIAHYPPEPCGKRYLSAVRISRQDQYIMICIDRVKQQRIMAEHYCRRFILR